MCVTLYVQASLKTFEDWKALQQEVATATGKHGLRLRGAEPPSKEAPKHALIVSYEDHCGCELVEKGSGPSDETWRFLPSVYAQLPVALKAIGERSDGPVKLAPYWRGSESDQPTQVTIRLNEFATICMQQELPANAEFTIE